MSKIDKAVEILEGTFSSKKMGDKDFQYLKSEWGQPIKPNEGNNRQAVAQAARKLGGKPFEAPLDDIRAHKSEWAPVFGKESFSPLYTGWWAFSLAALFGDEWWDAVGKVWLAANALAAIDPPSLIVVKTTRSELKRRIPADAKWPWGSKAPFS